MPAHSAWPRTGCLEDHWAWRPEWTCDRPNLWWYLTFEDRPSVAEMLAGARTALEPLNHVDVVPPRWLHLTVCNAGFVDEVDDGLLDAAVTAVAEALRGHPGLQLTLGPLTTLREAVVLAARPVEELRAFRGGVREVMAGVGLCPDQPGEADFWPHVSVGYLNRRVQRHELMHGMVDATSVRTEVTVDRLTLAVVSRRDRQYSWTPWAEIELAAAHGRVDHGRPP